MIKLAQESLGDLPVTIERPTYDRKALQPGILHVGLGNFHRAHQSWYLHRLMQQGLAHDWAIVGAGIRPFDREMRDKLIAQDHLTTLIELDPSGRSAEIVGSMIDYVPIEDGCAALIERMADPAIRIVSLTVTEGGYFIDPVTKRFDTRQPDILHDALDPDGPRTVFGAMVAALRLRRDGGIGPFTGLSCDNLQGNGGVLREAVVSLCRMSDPILADWIEENCSFPNSMVDCIVPATGPEEIALARSYGIDDAAPVTHENFRQWVIEDDFCAGRPDWNLAGAQFSNDVHGYESQKIRILNGGHQLLANAAEVMGIATISQAVRHRVIGAFFRKVEQEEILPHVVPVSGMTPAEYLDLIQARFANEAIVDTVRRVAFDGSSRHTGFVLPTVRDALAAGMPIVGLALAEACWARMCEGTREDGSRIEPNDPIWKDLTARASDARKTPRRWLEMTHVYGELADDPRFADAFDGWLRMIWADGVEAALASYLEG